MPRDHPDLIIPPQGTIAVLGCDVLADEVRALRTPGPGQLVLLQQGLHNEPDTLRKTLQQTIDQLEHEHAPSVIALVYGLCSRGIEGISAKNATLVAPRAHDCITLLLGDRKRYADYVKASPGTYWYSIGWNRCHLPPGPQRHKALRDRYVEKFGQDDADYLMETEQQWFSTYNRATFVDLGLTESAADEQYTRECASWLGWTFERQQGDPELLRDLINGPWDSERFIIARPGETFHMTADEQVMRVQLLVKGREIT